MRFAWLGCFLACGLLRAGAPAESLNVNARYTVESVELTGDNPPGISKTLHKELMGMVGEKLNPAALDDLATRIRHELHVRAVTHRLLRGQKPEHVRVVFVVLGRPARFDASVPQLVYRSDAGISGTVEGTATVGSHAFTAGVVSNGDDLAERYTGILARYEDKRLGSDRVRFRFDFESYHDQWNPATTDALARPGSDANTSGIYRSRDNVEPLLTFLLLRGSPGAVNLTVGASFEQLHPQLPAARTESAHAMVTTLRYHRRVEGSGANQQEWDAGYSLRAATSMLGSDFVYARHQVDAAYVYSWDHNQIMDEVTLGAITGRAPLFERFMLGNSTMLRGWNRFDLDPLGGNRVVYNTVEYRYRLFDIFYDSGTIWDVGQTATWRHSVGVGIRSNGLYAALAFPIKEGHIEPVFMVGMNY
ncbi:MAG TPA: BamA/TamA family outer membrane protein [Bryobacteraceae bacterium]|nr:BamA/TamA family outer membrane protein [Bryobacteraceae bacterium]